ncbi:MAG: cupin domain-containing protein, partial [Thermomicrobiales bacterium]
MSGPQDVSGHRPVSRRHLQGSAFGAFAAFAAVRSAGAWPGLPSPAPEVISDSTSLFLAFGAQTPERYAAGAVRYARTATFPALEGLGMALITLEPRALRELHWHINANELTHILSGAGVAIIYDGDAPSVVALRPGTLVFFPMGAAHAIWNTSDEPMELVLGFDHQDQQTINFSASLPSVPPQVLAQTAGVTTDMAPFLASAGIGFAVPLEGDPPTPTTNAGEFSTQMDQVTVERFPGGSRRVTSDEDIARMTGIKTTIQILEPGGTRLPHWHSHMSELAYCIEGKVQMGIAGQNGLEQTAVLAAGDLAFVPVNWLHYLTNQGDVPAKLALYHNA